MSSSSRGRGGGFGRRGGRGGRIDTSRKNKNRKLKRKPEVELDDSFDPKADAPIKARLQEKLRQKRKTGDQQDASLELKEAIAESKQDAASSSQSAASGVVVAPVNYTFKARHSEAVALVRASRVGSEMLAAAQQASQAGFDIVRGDRTQMEPSYSGGRDRIVISRDRALVGGKTAVAQMLVMELTNLANKAAFLRLDQQAKAKTISKEDYVKANERVEFQGVLNVIRAHAEGGNAWGKSNWANHIDKFDDLQFDSYYANYILKTAEGQRRDAYFRDIYDRIQAGAIAVPDPPAQFQLDVADEEEQEQEVGILMDEEEQEQEQEQTDAAPAAKSGLALLQAYESDSE